jgi:hypothetical protein
MNTTNEEKNVTKIGCWAAFWGDTRSAGAQLLREKDLDYLVADYLAEITMALLARARAKDPEAGFVPDAITSLQPHLAEIAERGIKVVTNAGALNPKAAAAAFEAAVKEAGSTSRSPRSKATICCRRSTTSSPPARRTCSPARRCPPTSRP